MRSSSSFGGPADNARRRPRVCGTRALLLLAALCCLGVPSLSAQSNSKGDPRRGGNDGERRGPSPQEIQSRALTSLRERFGVTDDEEWDVIAERLLKVFELRRSGADGGGFGRGGPPGGAAAAAAAKSRGGSFRGAGGTPEIQSLQAAVTEKLPDAELKLRLARLRDVRQLNEAKLRKAQEDLRAVLTVRQEAIAVLLGLLP